MLNLKIPPTLSACVLCLLSLISAHAQSPTTRVSDVKPAVGAPTVADTEASDASVEDVRRALREQQEELKRLQAVISEQARAIDRLRQQVEQGPSGSAIKTAEIPVNDSTTAASTRQQNPQASEVEGRLSRVEEQAKKTGEALSKQLGSITFSGDLRLRYEGFFGQLNALPNGDNPLILGNELSTRNRFRVRARLSMRGQIGKEFDWGLRLATGSLANSASANQTLTDFFTHKPFGLDQAFIAWTPQRVKGLRVQAGKFEPPWMRTEMMIDNDLNVEGFSQAYTRGFKKSAIEELAFVAWELPFMERSSAFVRNADGTVNLDQSSRNGRDLALYGAQARARLKLSEKTKLTLAAADLYFSGTQFITPIQFFGSQLQLPVTVTIPASGAMPAQTVTTQVSIPRDFLVPGNSNLGLSLSSTNATNRDGRLSSGYNLVNVIGRLDLMHSKRFPVMLLLDFVTNTQTRDVMVASASLSNVFLHNDENHGYWAELQVGKTRERGDVLFGYTFIRIEKDAVLTPFNYSDLIQASDIRTHRFNLSYAADPRVVLTLTGLVTERANGLAGVFGINPPGSLNRPTTRLQFDTVFRF